jgi:hypothetical protein
MRLHEHCYAQFNVYTRGGHPTGRFALSWGFYNLLGAIWLQIPAAVSTRPGPIGFSAGSAAASRNTAIESSAGGRGTPSVHQPCTNPAALPFFKL